MPNASPFNRLESNSNTWVTLYIEDQTIQVPAGDTVAAAILSAGLLPSRATPISNSQRAPYCLMGVCFECLVTIDGKENSQACMTQVQDGMRVSKQIQAPDLNAANTREVKHDK